MRPDSRRRGGRDLSAAAPISRKMRGLACGRLCRIGFLPSTGAGRKRGQPRGGVRILAVATNLRVSDLARELGMTDRDLVAKASAKGMLLSTISRLDAAQADRLRQMFAPAAAARAAPAARAVEKPVAASADSAGRTVVRRRIRAEGEEGAPVEAPPAPVAAPVVVAPVAPAPVAVPAPPPPPAPVAVAAPVVPVAAPDDRDDRRPLFRSRSHFAQRRPRASASTTEPQ